MSAPNSDDDFQQLRRLLACKQHEQPPPGYFTYFSDRVVAQIEIEQRARVTWWRAALAHFDARAALACAYGFAVSGLLFMGFRIAQIFDSRGAMAATAGETWLEDRFAVEPLAAGMHPSYSRTPATFLEAPIPSTQTVHPDPYIFRFNGQHSLVQNASFSW